MVAFTLIQLDGISLYRSVIIIFTEQFYGTKFYNNIRVFAWRTMQNLLNPFHFVIDGGEILTEI
jgi:hypothetical protein